MARNCSFFIISEQTEGVEGKEIRGVPEGQGQKSQKGPGGEPWIELIS
jgi:hypothetical protein